MSAIYDDFQRELSRFRVKYAAAPRREMIHLFLLALEREEIVSVAYREEAMLERLEKMQTSQDVRELVRHALIWAWKDEEMHAIYIRGAILRIGGPLLRLQAYTRQLAGAVGGWASSVTMHTRWREAPISHFLATSITTLGTLTGKVPRAVRESLDFGSFRDFCLYNVDAERTAWLCWQRIAELAARDPTLPPSLVTDFRRIEADEERHRQIFDIFANAFDDADRLAQGETAATLAAKIATVGEYFLPRPLRTESIATNPLGSGGKVFVLRGTDASDKLPLLRKIVEDAGLETLLRRRGKPISELRVAIKPTFMLGYDRRDLSILTDRELLDELARILRGYGCGDVAVIEAPNIYDHFYDRRTVADVAQYFGYKSPNYRLVDLSAEQVPHDYSRGLAQYTIGRTWKDADFRISFPKMRSHPIELAYLGIANVEWIGARCDQFLFCERQAQRQTAIMMLLDEFPPHFSIIDAYDFAADGLVGVMACPNPKSPRRLYAGADALSVDIVAARHMGIREARDSSMLRAAVHWFGDPSETIEVIGCDDAVAGWRGPYDNELWAMLSILSYPVYVLGSGRGALFVPEMDTDAFPLKERESLMLRGSRAAVRRLIGHHHAT